jgi:arylsulfatase A-like enzyme
LIFAVPGSRTAGQRTEALAEMVDIYPTLADLCGLKAPKYLSGVSLVPALKDPSATPRASALTQYGSGYSLRTERYRYTEWGEDGAEGAELYDRESDPEELINLAQRPESADRVRELSRLLRERIAKAREKPDGVVQIQFENRRWVR